MAGAKGISHWLLGIAVVGLQVVARGQDAGLDRPSTKPVRGRPDVRLGATITPRELGTLAPATVMADARAAGLSVVRIGVYWSEVQPSEDTPPDFSKTLEWVKAAEAAGLEVVLTVGIKAPRWPEFYLPAWAEPSPDRDEISKDEQLRRRALLFVERTVLAFKEVKAITHWQVENEPMNRSGEASYGTRLLGLARKKARWIGADFLAEEVAKVRSLDARPIVLNFWSADEKKSSAPWGDSDYAKRSSLALGDVIGLDVYPSTGGKADFSKDDVVATPKAWLAKARAAGKDAWIVEAQAEPWGDYKPSPEAVSRLIEVQAGLGYRTIFLWGFEWMERLAHSEDSREREQGRALLAAVARHGVAPSAAAPPVETAPRAPSKTPGLLGALGGQGAGKR